MTRSQVSDPIRRGSIRAALLALILIAEVSPMPPCFARDEHQEATPTSGAARVIAAEAECSTTEPQQARPPDSRFQEGTQATLIREVGRDALVQTDDGVRTDVSAVAIRPIQDRDVAMNAEVRTIIEGNNRFALDLYTRLGSRQDGNLFFSPASLSTALAMTWAGAEGETAEQMARVLHLQLPQNTLHPAFAALQQTWDADGGEAGYRLSMANRLWGQRDFDYRDGFLAVTREHYGAELARVDFTRQPEEARRQINVWIEEQTEGKIADLIPPGVLNAMTRLVLTNAVSFKGDWADPFRKEATQDAPFHVSARQQMDVPLMHRQGDFRYWAGDSLEVLELPYGRGDLAMLVLLPDEFEGLPALEARLTIEGLSVWLEGLREREVRVFLPRFTLVSQFQLAEVLGAMGMTRAFSPGEADFTGMSSEEELFLSAVVHEAFVDVNEEGTEAAAATGIAVGVTSFQVPEEPAVFRADHPFLFLIRDNRTGSILFLGRLANPNG